MEEKEKKPKIRFKGFTEAWEQRKVGEFGEVITGSTPSTQNGEYYSEDGILWVTPTDINSNTINDTAKKLSDEGVKVARTLPKESILVTCIASIGKNTMLENTGSCNQQINALIPDTQKYYPYFLLTESTLWSNKMLKSASAGTMQIVNKTEFSEIYTYSPEMKEQNRIGDLFKNIDNLITLHQRKYDKLVNIKKSLLEKMFPKNGSNLPELRFKGFTEAWEQCKLGEIIEETVDNRGKNPPYYCNSGIPIIDNFMIKNNGYPNLKNANRFLDEYLFNNFIRKYNKKDDVLITLVGNGIGNIALFPDKKGVIVQNTIGLRFKECLKFKYYLLMSKNKNIIMLDRGMAQPNIRQDELKNILIELPSIREQDEIGKLFELLDNLITLHQRKLEKLKNVKKSLLEKMFV